LHALKIVLRSPSVRVSVRLCVFRYSAKRQSCR